MALKSLSCVSLYNDLNQAFKGFFIYIILPRDLVFNQVNVVFFNFGRKSLKDHSCSISIELDNRRQRSRRLKVFT